MNYIHIGKILLNDNNYGILIGRYTKERSHPNYRSVSVPLLFWYPNSDKKTYTNNGLVFYEIVNFENYQVKIINSIDAYKLITNTENRKQRENGQYLCDEVWDLMKKGIVYIDGSFKKSYYLEFPKSANAKTIKYDSKTLCDIDAQILEAYYAIKENQDKVSVSLEETIKKMRKFGDMLILLI